MKFLLLGYIAAQFWAVASNAYELELVVDGLSSPIEFVQPEADRERYFVAEQSGLVHVIENGARLPEPLMDLRAEMTELDAGFEERGLLGFALHPEFATNGRLYVSYAAPLADSAPVGWNYTRRISEFTLDWQDKNRVDPTTERVLLALDWPSRKHNGGALSFGPDGHLFIGLGDGGGAHGVGKKVLWSAFEMRADQQHWDRLAQDTTSLFGSILRIDVDKGFPTYGIPADNPLGADQGRAEIYIWGVRNPYRISFDRNGSGEFLVPLVGETLWEAVYLAKDATNFGWPVREGKQCINRLKPRDPASAVGCATEDAFGYAFETPIIEYGNMQLMHPETVFEAEGVGTAVVDAQFYAGSALPELRDRVLFADWSLDFRQPSGQLFAATRNPVAGVLWDYEKIAGFESRIVGLAEDGRGEVIILTNDELGPFGTSGKVYRLVP